MDYRRTELAHNDPRCLVRSHNGVTKRVARAEHRTECRDHRVACAADIEYLAGAGGFMVHLPLFEKGHAVLTQGHEQSPQAKPLAQRLRSFRELVIVLPATRDFLQFLAIRRQDRKSVRVGKEWNSRWGSYD